MSELLRLANELIAARDKANMEEWGWHYRPGDEDAPASIHAKGSHISTAIAMCPRFGIDQFPHDAAFITLAANHAVDIVKGYQDLLRRAYVLLRHVEFDREFDYLEHETDEWLNDAIEALP